MRSFKLLSLSVAILLLLPAAKGLAQHGGGCSCGTPSGTPRAWEIELYPTATWFNDADAQFAKWNTYASVFGTRSVGNMSVSKTNGINEIVFLDVATTQSAYGFVIDTNTFGITWIAPLSAFGSPQFNACPPPGGTGCGSFTETDVIINSQFSRGFDTISPPDFNDSSGPAYFGATAVHEIGHALGLHHNFNNLSTMNYYEDYAAWYISLADADILRVSYPGQVVSVTDIAAYPFRQTGGFQYGTAPVTSISPTAAAAGATVTVSNWSLENVGTNTASNVSIAFYLSTNNFISVSDYSLGTVSFPTINADQYYDSMGWGFTLPAGIPAGTYFLGTLLTVNGSADSVSYNNTWVLDTARQFTVQPCYSFSLYANPPAGGGASVPTVYNCTNGYQSATGVAVNATPSAGYNFTGWSGVGGSFGNSSLASTTFYISGPASVTANFQSVCATDVTNPSVTAPSSVTLTQTRCQ